MSSFAEDFEPLVYFRGRFAAFYDVASSSLTSSGCDASSDDACRDDAAALQLKLAAIAAILIAGVSGVSLPLLTRKRRHLATDGAGNATLTVVKAFAAGVILATGFVHMLQGGQRALTSRCLPAVPWRRFPFSGFVAMASALATLMVDFIVTQFYERRHREEAHAIKSGGPASVAAAEAALLGVGEGGSVFGEGEECGDDDHMHIVGIRAHVGSHCVNTSVGPMDEMGSVHGSVLSQARHVVVSQILELGIVSHSVIIGLSLGVSSSPCTIRPLVAALSFHQFFEGFALGGCISQAQFKNSSAFFMACFFAVTTPIGIAIGACISSFYNPNSPRALVVEGILDSVSAGILIYMSLVDLIAADFQSRKMSSNARLMFMSYTALFLGAGMMSALAIWA